MSASSSQSLHRLTFSTRRVLDRLFGAAALPTSRESPVHTAVARGGRHAAFDESSRARSADLRRSAAVVELLSVGDVLEYSYAFFRRWFFSFIPGRTPVTGVISPLLQVESISIVQSDLHCKWFQLVFNPLRRDLT